MLKTFQTFWEKCGDKNKEHDGGSCWDMGIKWSNTFQGFTGCVVSLFTDGESSSSSERGRSFALIAAAWRHDILNFVHCFTTLTLYFPAGAPAMIKPMWAHSATVDILQAPPFSVHILTGTFSHRHFISGGWVSWKLNIMLLCLEDSFFIRSTCEISEKWLGWNTRKTCSVFEVRDFPFVDTWHSFGGKVDH